MKKYLILIPSLLLISSCKTKSTVPTARPMMIAKPAAYQDFRNLTYCPASMDKFHYEMATKRLLEDNNALENNSSVLDALKNK